MCGRGQGRRPRRCGKAGPGLSAGAASCCRGRCRNRGPPLPTMGPVIGKDRPHYGQRWAPVSAEVRPAAACRCADCICHFAQKIKKNGIKTCGDRYIRVLLPPKTTYLMTSFYTCSGTRRPASPASLHVESGRLAVRTGCHLQQQEAPVVSVFGGEESRNAGRNTRGYGLTCTNYPPRRIDDYTLVYCTLGDCVGRHGRPVSCVCTRRRP